jgi:glycosyltransferase involved in cell wall biosynthesis
MSKQKGIAFVCHAYHRGGVTRWMADAAAAAAQQRKDVYFITVEPVKPFVSAGGRETMTALLRPHPEVKLFYKPVNFLFEFGTEAYRAGIYRELIVENIPAGTPIVISDDTAVWSAVASVADKYPMVGVLHGDQDYYYDKARLYHEQLSLCVCVSNRVRRHAIQKCPGIDQGKLFTIPCGINLPQFAPDSSGDICKLIFIGRLTDYEKRAEDLVKISDLLHRQGFDFHLDIVGNSEESKAEYDRMFAEKGVGDRVTFQGWQAKRRIQELLNGSDILLLTSNSEGMPLVMMEALASGCAFTGTRVSGIEDYETAFLAKDCVTVYTVGDIEDAAVKIKAAAGVSRPQRQTAARKLAEAEFSMQVCLERYFDALATIKGHTKARQMPHPVGGVLYSNMLSLARYMKVRGRAK